MVSKSLKKTANCIHDNVKTVSPRQDQDFTGNTTYLTRQYQFQMLLSHRNVYKSSVTTHFGILRGNFSDSQIF